MEPEGPPAAASERVLTRDTLPLYLGGFLGPFGTLVVIPIYPELRESFDATTAQVNWSFSGYLLPMAVLMLFSGTLGERWGRRRVLQSTYLMYAVASFICVAAPTLGWFLGARVLQGCANAFITPLLIAGLTEAIAAERLGRAIGVYSSFQAAGSALAPLVGGLVAGLDWRYVFVAVGVVALVLANRPPEGAPRPAASAPSVRPLLSVQMVLLWVAAFTAAAGIIGANVIVGLFLRDDLDMGSATAGVVLLLGGLAAMLLGPIWGRLLDQWGAVRASFVSVAAMIVLIAPLGLITDVRTLTVAWAVAGGVTGFVVINLQNLSAIAVPENRGGALSTVMSFRFFGHAIGPLIWVPIFGIDPAWAFAGAAALGVVTLVSLVAAAVRVAGPGWID